MSNTFEFAERFGFQSPFEFQTDTARKIYKTGVLNSQRLISKLKKGSFVLDNSFLFSPTSEVTASLKSLEEYLLLNPKKQSDSRHFNQDAVDKKFKGQFYLKPLISTQTNKTISKRNAIYSYNIDINDLFFRYRVLFPFNDYTLDDRLPDRYGISIETEDYDGLEAFLEEIGLKFDQKEKNKIATIFKNAFEIAAGDRNKLDELYEKAPSFVLASRGTTQLIIDLKNILSGTVDDSSYIFGFYKVGTNEELVVLRIIKTLREISNTEGEFLELFLAKYDDKNPIINQIFFKLDGENAKEFISIIQDSWKQSIYAETDEKKPHKIKITDKNPTLLSYRSNKALGFHTDNATIEWNKNTNFIDIDVTVGTGVFKSIPVSHGIYSTTLLREVKETHNYNYHPFSPIAIINSDNPEFIYKDKKQENKAFTLLPAFVLLANEKSAFWQNFVTGTLYAIDVLTTFSGVLNILKAGRLFRILKAGHSIVGKSKVATKVILGVKAVAGGIEVTSGTVNGLLKLIGKSDTPLGRQISEYLFYLEMLSLSAESAIAIYSKMTKSAKGIVKSKEFAGKVEKIKNATKNGDELKEVDEAVKHLEEISGLSKKLTRNASKSDIESLAKIRKRFNAGKKKNIANTKGEIGGEKIDLQSRSGIQKGTPENFDSFESIKPENYHYKDGPEPLKINHTEQKHIEYLYKKYKNNKLVKGKIEIISDLKICDNCDWIINSFQKDFPNIEIIRVWVRTKLN